MPTLPPYSATPSQAHAPTRARTPVPQALVHSHGPLHSTRAASQPPQISKFSGSHAVAPGGDRRHALGIYFSMREHVCLHACMCVSVCVCLCLCVCVSVCLCVCRTRRLSQSVSRHPCVCTHMSAGHRHITSDSASSTVAAAQAHISQTLEPGTIVSLISKSELRCPHLAHGVTDAMTVPCYFPRLTWSMRDARFPPPRPVPSAAGGNPRSERGQCPSRAQRRA